MEALGLIIPLVILTLLLASWAHLANHRRSLAVALFVVFGGFSLLLILFGGVGVLLADVIQRELDDDFLTRRDGWFLILMGMAVGLPLLPPVRAVLARVTPIEARSVSDMVGLSVIVSVGVLMIWTMDAADGEPDLAPISPFMLIVQASFLVIVAYFGIGGAITRDLSNVRERLGLYMPTSKQVAISILLIIPIFIVSAISATLTEWLQPDVLEQVEDVMGEVTRDVTNFQGAIVIGLSAGIGEEVLFRGAVQPRYGIFFTSVIFTLIHVQYALSFILLGVFVTGLILGIQRIYMNTTCCIITHAVYNFAIVMLSTLA